MDKEKIEETVENQESDAVEEEVLDETTDEQTDDFEAKYKDVEDKYLRLRAEFDNYQKRTAKEKESRYADAVIDTVLEFLPVLDDLQRAVSVEVNSDEAKQVQTGVEMVYKKMRETLDKLDVEEIKAVGEEFDPNIHNAIMHIEDETVAENTIVEEFMKGYTYKNGRVVRHSMVKVAN